ncbi:alpha/beta hydrolase-fold protein [Phytoactinopolyspora limicola]|uniref:alpha/beta hydrolase-fold protein n=1 Tax=Phytoactinopolyspora limicola TaxID=2715536 RepID=UPI00140CA058|nr:alpha/beta hydrolase-fold protein [Phytoactinopolyspora limicola]
MRSTILRRFAEDLVDDPALARARLSRQLTTAAGPLVEPVGQGTVLVTFVLIGRSTQPAVRCALFPGLDPSVPMSAVPGAPDVWYLETTADDDVSLLYQFQKRPVTTSLDDGTFSRDPSVMAAYVEEIKEVGFADPVNPISHPGVPPIPGQLWESELTLPGAPPLPWQWADAPAGRLTTHQVWSEVLNNSRTVTAWRPAGWADTRDLPVVVLLDGETMLDSRIRSDLIFDHLVDTGHLTPFVALLVHNVDSSSRIVEYPCHPAFPTFVADELLPQLRTEVGFSTAPTNVAIGGYSYGGLAALWTAFTRPDALGAVASMSASVWWGPSPNGAEPSAQRSGRDDQPEWLIRQIDKTDQRDIRVWVDVGKLETSPLPFAAGLSQLAANRHLRDVLIQRGYELVGYHEQAAGHDLLNWRRTLPQALVALFGPAA